MVHSIAYRPSASNDALNVNHIVNDVLNIAHADQPLIIIVQRNGGVKSELFGLSEREAEDDAEEQFRVVVDIKSGGADDPRTIENDKENAGAV